MATQKEQKPQETRETATEREVERKSDRLQESHNGLPGYGQPPEDVRAKQLPDQKW